MWVHDRRAELLSANSIHEDVGKLRIELVCMWIEEIVWWFGRRLERERYEDTFGHCSLCFYSIDVNEEGCRLMARRKRAEGLKNDSGTIKSFL